MCFVTDLLQSRFKISVNTNISVIGFYGYIGNFGKYRWIFLQKYRKRENYIKFMKILRNFLKMIKISKIHILELFNIK